MTKQKFWCEPFKENQLLYDSSSEEILLTSDGSGSKLFDPGQVGSIFSVSGWVGLGRVSHLWFGFEFGKFPLKMSNFSIFFPSGKKKSLRVRLESTRVEGGSASYLLRAKSKLRSGQGPSLLLNFLYCRHMRLKKLFPLYDATPSIFYDVQFPRKRSKILRPEMLSQLYYYRLFRCIGCLACFPTPEELADHLSTQHANSKLIQLQVFFETYEYLQNRPFNLQLFTFPYFVFWCTTIFEEVFIFIKHRILH